MFFQSLTGFPEISPDFVRENIELHENSMTSKVNGRTFQHGTLEVVSLQDLRDQTKALHFSHKISVDQIVGNVQNLHVNEENRHGLFQAASQFNLLEMVNPQGTPEAGIDIYENDRTQGPACAIACAAGTIYRNYFALVNGKIGQSQFNQIDGLELFGAYFENSKRQLWEMTNGYALFNEVGLHYINTVISQLSPQELEDLKGKLKIGIQWNTEVTLAENPEQIVSQIYCSALPIGYTPHIPVPLFEKFARLILEATYEATFLAGLMNIANGGSPKVFLTLVGGGVFQNNSDWILDAIYKSALKFKNSPLEIKIVSYGEANPKIEKWLKKMKSDPA